LNKWKNNNMSSGENRLEIASEAGAMKKTLKLIELETNLRR